MTSMVIPKADNPTERARRATQQSKKMLGTWSAFARMLARKSDLKVRLTGGTPCTDGETVWLQVPIELGDEVPHEKAFCGKRNTETLAMLCPACRSHDSVNTTIFHEMAHIIHGSFEEVDPADRLRIIDTAIKLECDSEETGTRAAKIIRKIEATPEWQKSNWMMVANLVSPFLPMLLNAVEDVWVNAEMMSARPGTRTMFGAQTNDVFNNGIETLDGHVVKWSEQPLNAQVVIGVYCKGSGLDYSSWLAPEVIEALDDDEVDSLSYRIKTATTARARYQLSIKLLEALRRLGFLKSDDDEEDDEPDPGEGEAGDDSDGGDSGGDSGEADSDDADDEDDDLTSTGKKADTSDDEGSDDEPFDGADKAEYGDEVDSDDGEASRDTDDSDDAESITEDGENGSGGSPPPMGSADEAEEIFKTFGRHDDESEEPSPEQEDAEEDIERALVQDDHFDKPAHGTRGLAVHRADDGHQAFSSRFRGGVLDPTPESILAPSLAKLRIAFTENRKSKHEKNLKRGRRIDRKQMARRIATDDPRIFNRRNVPGKRDYFVVIGLDISGSTASRWITLIKQAGMAQAELLARLGIPFALYCHSGDYVDGVTIFEIKGPDEPWGDKPKEALDRIGSYAANLDGHTLEFYRKRAEEHRASDKLIMYYTDGAMPAENYVEELDVLQRNIKVCEQQGIHLVGVGVGNDDPIEHGLDMIRIDGIEDVLKVVEGLRTRLA